MFSKNLKINGKIYFAGMDRDDKDKLQVLLEIDNSKVDKLCTVVPGFDSYDFVPVKTGSADNERTKDKIFFKASSKYDVKIYDERGEETEDIDITELGAGSDVTLFVNIKESEYKRKKGLVAYLSQIKVNEFVEKTAYNPFESDDDEI